jgi:hypothetical protein
MNPITSNQIIPTSSTYTFNPQLLNLIEQNKINRNVIPILNNGLKVYLEKLLDGLIQVSKQSEAFDDYKANRFYKGATNQNQNVK